ncbi:hypothetical protein CAOG_03591 [Capsaspora owczarzaki ATCC 30864]|uniref:AP complex subunit beta n=1 Tax=Capsaspora owczarzaki (strain ATCC 30864) TaxID=595528 RepID=A0A0D2VQ42_CAPO3|nr:hypothetical protein CAOG_03591 [Capsaspora owczarzaki ATCC 30864]KJE92672.1 hypothetical protein CAOG_003591 [Capsaspora owczarzaki ATCC 30864]|eukprot:XP_004363319.1 hypothetical protein CAOG_03591 [Capsaspora owczarzaki ATCC 30864]
MSQQHQSQPQQQRPGGYFVDPKRGEVGELRSLLRNPEIQRDVKKHRQAVQKVIATMTHGIDVSPLFSEMIMVSASKDITLKKMVYLYLCNYAESNSELSLLVINTLQKDCRDENPMIRGLALRNMCSLRLSSLLEYILPPLKNGLADRSPYVRKTAVMGVLKVYYLNQQAILDSGLVSTVYSLLTETSPVVVVNCLVVLNEIFSNEGGIEITKPLAYMFLNRLLEFNEWAQGIVLDFVRRYSPTSEDEVYEILNVLDSRFKHANAGVVFAAVNVFLQMTDSLPHLLDDVYQRVKVPLLTFMSTGTPEMSYVCLQHLHILLQRRPRLFESDIKLFFCKHQEPTYVKLKKLELLTDAASVANIQDVVDELTAYVTDVDVEMASRSIAALSKIAMRFESCAEFCINQLISFLELDISHVSASTLLVLTDVLRKFPDRAADVLPQLSHCLSSVDIPEARAAIIWMLGEFGEALPASPYLLETVVENVKDEPSHVVRQQLLTSCMKLFFKRAPECQSMLGQLLEYEVNDETHMDVHDRALLYYRLLRNDVEQAARILSVENGAAALRATRFAEDELLETREKLLEVFNSLSVVYNQVPEAFLSQQVPYTQHKAAYGERYFASLTNSSEGGQSTHDEASRRVITLQHQSSTGNLLDVEDDMTFGLDHAAGDASIQSAVPMRAAAAAAAPHSHSLHSDQDLLGLGAEVAPRSSSVGVQLVPNATLDPQNFENLWFATTNSVEAAMTLSVVPTMAELERTFAANNIATMASSEELEAMRFYFYAQLVTGDYVLIEAVFDIPSQELAVTLKADQAPLLGEMVRIFKSCLIGKFMNPDD